MHTCQWCIYSCSIRNSAGNLNIFFVNLLFNKSGILLFVDCLTVLWCSSFLSYNVACVQFFSGKQNGFQKFKKIKIHFHNFLYLLQDYIDCRAKYMIFIGFANIIKPILVVLMDQTQNLCIFLL
jgi:hypothetical protein